MHDSKTLQYLMGHRDIGVILNIYTYLGLEDAMNELRRMEELENARKNWKRQRGEGCFTENVPSNLRYGEFVRPALAGLFKF